MNKSKTKFKQTENKKFSETSSKMKQTEIGKIPEDWEVDTLIKHLYIKGRIGWKGLKKSEYFKDGSGIAIINGLQIQGNRLNWDECGRVPKWRYDESPEIQLKEKDIVMTKDGTIGKVAFIDTIPEPTSVASGIFVIREESGKINQKFLFYYFKSPIFKWLMETRKEGSVVPHLYQRDFEDFLIALPPLQEQSSIAKILSDLDSKIETNTQMNQTLESIGQAIFKHWFVDFEFHNEQGKPYKSSGGEMIDSELGKIPKGWEIKQIKDCGKVICGKTPPTKEKDNYGSDMPFITIPDMRNQSLIVKTERRLSTKGAETQKKKELPPLSVCVSCIATPGIVALTTEPSHTNQQINSIIYKGGTNPYFIYYVMKNKSEEIKQMGLGGTATLNLNTGNFEKIELIYPLEEIMKKFHEYVENIFKRLLINAKENLTLIEIRDLLLPKLMSGQIRVPVEVKNG